MIITAITSLVTHVEILLHSSRIVKCPQWMRVGEGKLNSELEAWASR